MYKKAKSTKGITLVALVITVIVLLILSSVTINGLKGKNGIITKSTDAKEATAKATTLEDINLEILSAMSKGDGEVDNGALRNGLEEEGIEVKTDGDDLPWKVIEGKNAFVINEDYSVEEITGIILSKEIRLEPGQSETITVILGDDATGKIVWESSDNSVATVEDGKVTAAGQNGEATITAKVSETNYEATCKVIVKKSKTRVKVTAAQIAENPQKYYGQLVLNYTQGGLDYRIYFVDKNNKFGDGANTIYLKADYKEKKSLSVDTSVITDEDMAVYKRMNPSWAAERGSVTKSNWKGDERAAGWLCAPSQWTTYVDSTKANYAIGGSSLEMYVDSYNQVPHTEIGNYVLGAKYSSETEGSTVYAGYRYTLNGSLSTISNIAHSTGDDTIDYIGYNSMYAGTNGTKTGSWWLSSTASRAPDGVSCVYGGWAMLSGATYISSFGIEPVVSLKTGVSVEIEE